MSKDFLQLLSCQTIYAKIGNFLAEDLWSPPSPPAPPRYQKCENSEKILKNPMDPYEPPTSIFFDLDPLGGSLDPPKNFKKKKKNTGQG